MYLYFSKYKVEVIDLRIMLLLVYNHKKKKLIKIVLNYYDSLFNLSINEILNNWINFSFVRYVFPFTW